MITTKVLDHGVCQLWDWMGNDMSVVNAARASFNKETDKYNGGDARLIKYLAKHNHWTPFGHVQLTMKMTMPLFVRAQWMRSTVGIVYNEESRRYVDYVPDYYTPTRWRSRPEGNIKQGSGDYFDTASSEYRNMTYLPAVHDSLNAYDQLLEQGVAPEMARMVLPQSMYTTFIMSGSIAALARVYNLRSKDDAQYEIRQYAEAMGNHCYTVAPDSWQALTDKEEE